MSALSKHRKNPSLDIDAAANQIANRVGADRRKMIARRKWAAETAMLCSDEMTAAERIGLAKLIDDYVYEGET